MTSTEFIPGKLYHRRNDIHRKFKEQERGGIITPAEHNIVLVVTGDSSRQHGSEDTWSDDGSAFLYSQRKAIYPRRSRAIRLYALRRSQGNCEGCGTPAPFITTAGDPYLEPYHIRRLTDTVRIIHAG